MSTSSLGSAVLIVAALTALAGCRLDMHDQPRFKPLRISDFYADQRSSRPLVQGTVARGQLRDDTYFYTGMINGEPGNVMPFPVSREVLDRGRERYNIYCSPCHSELGDGNGVIVQRGYRRPPSYHIDRLRQAPVGHFFDVITNGFGAMPDYASQVPPRDRWCIIAYIRALQLSQQSAEAAVQADKREQLDSQPSEGTQLPGMGVTQPANTAPPAENGGKTQ